MYEQRPVSRARRTFNDRVIVRGFKLRVRGKTARSRGFTLVELAVVIAIVAPADGEPDVHALGAGRAAQLRGHAPAPRAGARTGSRLRHRQRQAALPRAPRRAPASRPRPAAAPARTGYRGLAAGAHHRFPADGQATAYAIDAWAQPHPLRGLDCDTVQRRGRPLRGMPRRSRLRRAADDAALHAQGQPEEQRHRLPAERSAGLQVGDRHHGDDLRRRRESDHDARAWWSRSSSRPARTARRRRARTRHRRSGATSTATRRLRVRTRPTPSTRRRTANSTTSSPGSRSASSTAS